MIEVRSLNKYELEDIQCKQGERQKFQGAKELKNRKAVHGSRRIKCMSVSYLEIRILEASVISDVQ